jgi:hypothetical protein
MDLMDLTFGVSCLVEGGDVIVDALAVVFLWTVVRGSINEALHDVFDATDLEATTTTTTITKRERGISEQMSCFY